jgi:trigger factor
VRRLYGKSLMGEVVEKTLNDTSQKVLSEKRLRIAAQPDLKPVSDMDQVLAGREDLAYDLEVEVMPEFEPTDITALTLQRPVYEPDDAEVDAALERLAGESKTYAARAEAAPAQEGDQILMDFVGRIDGEAFEGGAADDAELVIGSGQFIPGFEPQLIGAVAGEAREIEVDFPADYQVERLAGRHAVFTVAVKEVREPQAAQAGDALAKSVGLEDLSALRAALKENIGQEYRSATRFKLKRALLDALDERHDIPLPPRMVDSEFSQIWTQVEKDRAEGQLSPEDEGKSEEILRAEYHKIAQRRVRLGLVLAEIGRRNNVQVSEAELSQAMRDEAMRYGEQAQEIFDLMRRNPNLQASMRAPIYEEKVVDLIFEKAQVTDKPVTREELLRDDDLPASLTDAAPPEAEAPAKTARKAKAKTKAKAEEAEPEAAPAKAPRKPRAKAAQSAGA